MPGDCWVIASTSHRIYLADHSMYLTDMMRTQAIVEGKITPTLVQDEFTMSVLMQHGVIDRDCSRRKG